MRKVAVPAPPLASFEEKPQEAVTNRNSNAAAAQRNAPLDAAFLSRVYRVNWQFGALLTLCAAMLAKSVDWPLSVAAGVLTGLLLLKTQELFVRRVIRPMTWPAYEGPDKKFPLWLMVPGKYALVIAAIWLLRHVGWLNYAGFLVGCTAVQITLLSMALGRLLHRRRSIREVYVQPHVAKH